MNKLPIVLPPNVTILQATIFSKNFAGRPGQYNKEGARNFCLNLDEATAMEMTNAGWPVRCKPTDEGGQRCFIPVNLRFDVFPPNISVISQGIETPYSESTIQLVDRLDVEYVDVMLRPYAWEYGLKTGIKAYVKTMAVYARPDPILGKFHMVGT
jgi:hypothetical protein